MELFPSLWCTSTVMSQTHSPPLWLPVVSHKAWSFHIRRIYVMGKRTLWNLLSIKKHTQFYSTLWRNFWVSAGTTHMVPISDSSCPNVYWTVRILEKKKKEREWWWGEGERRNKSKPSKTCLDDWNCQYVTPHGTRSSPKNFYTFWN